jgi:hypothetical protein
VRTLYSAAFLAAALLIVGCGGGSASMTPSHPVHLSWKDDGNPLAFQCVASKVNCKSNLIVINLRTGDRVSLPITTTSYDEPSVDTYEVHVTGFDKDGNAIESVCCTLTPTT